MGTGSRPVHVRCVAVDVHYLRSGGARAAAVVAADAAFSQVLAERTAVVPEVPPYQPGELYRRELPPLRAVLDDIGGLGLLVVDGYADLDPGGRPGLGAHAHAELDIPVIGVAKSAFATATHAIPVPGDLHAPGACHRRRNAPRRRGRAGPPYGGPVPGTRRAAPRRRTRPHRPTGGYSGEPSPRLIDARNAADAEIHTEGAAE
jgi:deoxyribonuclease V